MNYGMTAVPVGLELLLRKRGVPPARAATVYGVAGAVAISIYFVVSPAAQAVLYGLIGVSAVVAIYIGAIRSKTSTRLAWQCFALGLLCEVLGDTASSVYELALGREPPVPSPADAFYLAGYPLLACGIVLLLRRRGGVSTLPAALDALILSVAIATLQWIFLVEPYNHVQLANDTRAVSMAYPAMDVLLLAGLAQLLVGSGRKSVSYRLLIFSVALWIVGDEIFALTQGHYAAGGWVDTFWLASYVAWGAAALTLLHDRPSSPERRAVPRLTRGRLALLSAALLAVPSALLVEQAHGHRPHTIAAAIGAALIAVLVMSRLAGLVRAVDRARQDERRARREAELAGRWIEAQNEDLRELDRMKDEFVASVSHELRTPLTSIVGYVELLLEEAGDPKSRSHLEVVQRNASRLLGLVSDLLFAARLQSGSLVLDAKPVDLCVLAEQAVASARPPAQIAGVTLHAELTRVPTVEGEEVRLAQLLDNLISNAIKFTPAGGAVDVTLGAVNGSIRIEVSDTGIGIEESEQPLVFERFFRSPAALDRQIPGTGLGLYISKAIVDAHHGTIAAHSGRDGGTTFVVDLPAGAAQLCR
jgi:signal transduction histidine kinase